MASQKEVLLVNEAFMKSLKNNRQDEALKLLDRVTSVDTKDQATGKSALHYAASLGSTELVTKLLERGADIHSKDQNEDTPLHLAVESGHEKVVAILVSFSAKLDEKNKYGYVPLYVAVRDKSPRMVEILLKFGRDPSVTEWDWTTGKKLSPKEDQILEAFGRQCSFLPGFKNGLITSEVFYVRRNSSCCSDSCQLSIISDDITSPFVFQCYKMQLEYSNVKVQLKKKEDSVSDLYECRTWNCCERELKLLVTVNGTISKNRRLKFVSTDKTVGRIDKSYQTIQENNIQKTIITVYVSVKDSEYRHFLITSTEKREKMKISREAVILKPKLAPGTEITIPQNAFSGDCRLSLKVIDTKETNNEEEKCMIVTDAIAVHTSDGTQPQKEVDMKLPIHSKVDSSEVVVLASKDDHPDSVDDWEIMEPVHDSNSESVKFKTGHFSLFVGVARAIACTSAGMTEIHNALERSIARKKKVVFMVFTKPTTEEGDYSVIVQCALARKQRQLEKQRKIQGYSLASKSDTLICTVNSMFQILLSGNIEEVFHAKTIALEFQLSRDNWRIFNVCIVNKENETNGKINIEMEVKTIKEEHVVEIVGEEHTCCCCICCKGKPETRPVTKHVEEVKLTPLFECDVSFVSEVNDEVEEIINENEVVEVKKSTNWHKIFDGFRLVLGEHKKQAPK